MMTQVNNEIFWLTLTLLMTALFWVPYILNRMKEHGPWTALYNPQPDTRPTSQWAERMMRAHQNAVENIVIMAPLVLSVEVLGLNSHISATASGLFFFARLLHFVLYTFRVPLLRTVAFLVGFCCQATLAGIILGA